MCVRSQLSSSGLLLSVSVLLVRVLADLLLLSSFNHNKHRPPPQPTTHSHIEYNYSSGFYYFIFQPCNLTTFSFSFVETVDMRKKLGHSFVWAHMMTLRLFYEKKTLEEFLLTRLQWSKYHTTKSLYSSTSNPCSPVSCLLTQNFLPSMPVIQVTRHL